MIRQAKLGDYLAKRSRGIVPASTPDETFELYSVPAFDGRRPEIVTGGEIGSNKQIVEPGTVLLCKINPRINRAWPVGSFTKHQKIASTEWITFPPHSEVEPRYLAHYLSRKEIRDYLAANASGVGGSLMRVKASTVEDLPLLLPSIAEQRRIVAEIEKQFSRLDEAVANLKRVKANLTRYRDQVLNAAVAGRLSIADSAMTPRATGESATGYLERVLRLRRESLDVRGRYREPAAPGASCPVAVPDGWVLSTVEQLAWVDVGFAFRSAEFAEEGIRLLRGENIEPGALRWEDVRHWSPTKLAGFEHLMLEEGQIVLAMDRPIISSGLKLARVKASDLPCLLVQRMTRLRCVDREVEPYLHIAMSTEHFRRHLLGGQTGTQLPHVSGATIASFVVPLPPPNDQRRIAAEVDRRLSIVREVEAEVNANLNRAQALRQSTLASAFSLRHRSEG